MHPTRPLAALTLLVATTATWGQAAPKPPSYGAPITLDAAKKAAAAAVAEAQNNGWAMTVAITDPSGGLVYFERMDDCQTGSIETAIAKSRSAAMYKRPTKAFNEGLAKGNSYILALPNASPVEGGFPLMVDGKVVGAIGASGGNATQDSATAMAGTVVMR